MNSQSKKILCCAILGLLCLFMLISCGKSKTADLPLAPKASGEPQTLYSYESVSETEIVEESSSEEKATTKESLREKIDSVTLKNKKPITVDEAYKQTDKEKQEEKEQHTDNFDNYQEIYVLQSLYVQLKQSPPLSPPFHHHPLRTAQMKALPTKAPVSVLNRSRRTDILPSPKQKNMPDSDISKTKNG